MKKIPNKREFLNEDKTMPGCIISEFEYLKRKEGGEALGYIWLTLGDCSRTIKLEFEVRDYKERKVGAKKSLKKAKIIKKHIDAIVEALEGEL